MEARVVVFVLCLTLCLLAVPCDARRRRIRIKGRQLRSEDIRTEGAENGNQTGFGPWGPWTKCNSQCKQMKFRRCQEFEKCKNVTQKYIRSCRNQPHCHKKNLVTIQGSNQNGQRVAQTYVRNDLIPFFYSEWSSWSPCSQMCYTKRIRVCQFPRICQDGFKEDHKFCYNRGDDCERKYVNYLKSALPDRETNLNELLDHPLENNITCGVPEIPSADLRITGGRRAVKGSWPWQVLILNKHHQPYCGGALLSSQWVLTAAHCLRLGTMYVIAGEHDLSRIEDTEQEEMVASFFMHPDYDPLTVDNDLALLRLRNPVEFTPYVSPVCLPDESEVDLPYFSRATILGWGKRRNESFYGTDVLHQAEVPIVSMEDCFKAYGKYGITQNMICAGFKDGKVDSCRGDSGGPLLHKRPNGSWAVYGVTSFGDGCGEKDKYGVYANIMKHLPWIWTTLQWQ